MNVAIWAEVRRLAEIEKLSGRAISQRLHCSRHTVAAALELDQPPASRVSRYASNLDAHTAKIDALLAKYPDLSAVRIREEIARGPDGYTGSVSVVRRYLRKVRPARGRIYQEVHYEPGQAMQIDWGECGRVQVGNTTRKVSVFVAVLCYSRLIYTSRGHECDIIELLEVERHQRGEWLSVLGCQTVQNLLDGGLKVTEGRVVAAVQGPTLGELPQSFDEVQVGRVRG